MATLKQIEANRLNAQKSSGPRSEEGKRVSSQNALKSGLDAESQFVLGETREEFAQLQFEWYQHHAPRNPEERLQVDNLIRNEWALRRFFRVEAQLWEHTSMEAQRGTGVELGEAFAKASPIFMRLQRRITAADKALKEAKVELQRLKALPQTKETTVEVEQMGSFLTPPLSDPPASSEIAQMDLALRQKLPDSSTVNPVSPESV